MSERKDGWDVVRAVAGKYPARIASCYICAKERKCERHYSTALICVECVRAFKIRRMGAKPIILPTEPSAAGAWDFRIAAYPDAITSTTFDLDNWSAP